MSTEKKNFTLNKIMPTSEPIYFLIKFQKLIELWAPLKKLSNSEKKTQNKPWITKGILKSISIKSKFFLKYVHYLKSDKKRGNRKKNEALQN